MEQQYQLFSCDQYAFNHNIFLKNLDFEPVQDYADFLSNESDSENIDPKLVINSKKISKKDKSSPISAETPKARAVRNLWKSHEDELLVKLYAEHGPKWTLIGRLIGNRTCKQVRDRYLNNLRPNIKNEPFTQEEDEQLVALYYQFGTKWKQVASIMSGRTQSQVKNRFYLHLKDTLANFKINPFAVTKKDSACSASTVDTEYGQEDAGFGFISYDKEERKPIMALLEEQEEFDLQINLIRDSSYKLENLL